MNVFAFDIETVPDIDGGRRLLGLEDLADSEVVDAMQALRRAETGGTDFQRLHLHRVVVISIAAQIEGRFRLFSLGGDEAQGEGDIIQRFFDGIERYTPVLVSWNGSGFDLPVLHYRGLMHGVSAGCYWDTGAANRDFRFNNYLNRFHERHLDLMDVLAGYQARANAALEDIASLCGLPGKMGMSGAEVAERVTAGDVASVRDYCETDVLNTYLLYLRFQRFRGQLDGETVERECERVRSALDALDRPHLRAFLEAWQAAARPPE